MCGIAGVVGHAAENNEMLVRTMVGSLARRGPDGEGIESWPSAVLGHRRLAIFDLSEAGRQPMRSTGGDIGVVFNGAIYNFLQLREELRRLGHHFHSECDTEVLVEGYLRWGIDKLVARLQGMFAFAVWDNRAQKLFLVRDRLGVKPLIYAERNGSLVFASTVRAIRDAGLSGPIDPKAVLEFLEFGFVTDDRTIYEGVDKLPAATILEWHAGRISRRSYWKLPQADAGSSLSFNEAVERTEQLILEAVKLRLAADVPVGALLSGGIDSTLVCWAMKELGANIRSFTVGANGDPSDEAADASETARILGIPHEVVDLPADHPSSFEDLTTAYSEPFACSSAMAMLRISRAIRPAVTVLLTGDGGDDVYLGYPFHQHFRQAERLSRVLPPGSAQLWFAARPLIDRVSALRRPKHFLDYATGGLGAVTRVHDGLPYFQQRNMLGDRIAGQTIRHRLLPLSGESARNLMRDYLDYDQNTRFVAEFMTKVDGGTMYYGIEARSPLLDQKLWEFAAALPVDLRMRGGELKAVLREIVRRRVGPQVAHRPKRGFTVPVCNWLTQPHWRLKLDELRSSPFVERENWIRAGAINDAINEAVSKGKMPLQLWYVLVLEGWLRQEAAAKHAPVLAGQSS